MHRISRTWRALGRYAYEMLGQDDEAIACYQQTVSAVPTHTTALSALGTRRTESLLSLSISE
jgi:hypothetical protein